MGYYMRFISTDERKISLKELDSALKENDSKHEIESDEDDVEGTLIYDDGVYGQLEVNEKGDGIFEEEIEMLRAEVESSEAENISVVLKILEESKSLLFVRVVYGGRDEYQTFERINVLWDWLLRNRKGLVHADNEGFYDASGLIFEIE